ncbi:hypothetical protein LEP3755_17090 [Leptolyngbya sp. NIES-3755]|nr:hypothetical protein LEP3755_17090 [Leptolyngbya sp. NIES-3755]
MRSKWWSDRTNQQVLAILLAGFLFRSFIAYWLPPGFDEAYYYIYTLNPALSYFDHPPLVALVTAIGIWLTGDVTQFSIRLGSLLLFPFTLYFLYRATVYLFSVRVGLITLAIASVIPIFQLGFGTFTLPDSPLMFFWALTLWVGAIEFFPRNSEYKPTYRIALIGLFVGLACLGKYHGFLLGFGLLGFCLTSQRHWKVFRSPWTILSFLLFLVVFSPVLYWNSQHEWVSFVFQGNRSVPDRTYNVLSAFNVALMASLYLFPTFGFPLWFVSIREIISVIRSKFSNSIQSFILWNSAPVFLIFTIIGGYQQILPGWTMPGFFTVTPLLGLYASRWRSTMLKRWLNGSTITITALMLLALSHIVLGTLQKPSQYAIFGGVVAPENDASIQLIDVGQLRRELNRSPKFVTALKNADFVFSNRFHLAGHIAMSIMPINSIPITCFDRRDLRGFAYWSTAEQWVGKTALYMTTDEFQTREDSAAGFAPYFEKFTKLGEIPLRRGGVIVDRIHVFQGTNLLNPFPRPY